MKVLELKVPVPELKVPDGERRQRCQIVKGARLEVVSVESAKCIGNVASCKNGANPIKVPDGIQW